MAAELTPDAFRNEFALAAVPGGGVVLNVARGSYWALNGSAAAILEEFDRATDQRDAIVNVVRRLGIDERHAARDLATVLSTLNTEGVRQEPLDPFRYRLAEGGGYNLWQGDMRVLHVSPDGTSIQLVADPAALPLRLYDYTSAVAPKVMFLLGMAVLHGSSCRAPDGTLLCMCGKSRAGKTTTARTLSRCGYPLESEDLLVLGPDLSAPRVFVRGEATVNRWSIEIADAMQATNRPLATEDLFAAHSGQTRPLGRFWFLDVARRRERFLLRPLTPAQALPNVMNNQFLGAGAKQEWRRHLSVAQALASAVPASEAHLPNGLERLEQALRSYTTSSAS
jgi:hypothetical protein